MTKVNPQSCDDASTPSDKNADLVAFLRQHAPPVPEADVDEEDRLMKAIALHPVSVSTTAQARAAQARNRASLKRLGFGFGCSILIYALWQLFHVVVPTPRSAGELAEIENFWLQNWDGVANAEEAPPWLADGDSSSDRPEYPSKLNYYNRSSARQE